jgi:hypothetical protein
MVERNTDDVGFRVVLRIFISDCDLFVFVIDRDIPLFSWYGRAVHDNCEIGVGILPINDDVSR